MRNVVIASSLIVGCGLLAGIVVLHTSAAEKDDKPYSPPVAAASDEAQKAIKRFRLPKGVQASVFAAEPMLANPVSFCFDEKGRCYVAETFRLKHGVTDNREHMNWLDDDLACRTVDDRVAMYKKWHNDKFAYVRDRARPRPPHRGHGGRRRGRQGDRLRRRLPPRGGGTRRRRAGPEGNVWYTCIPDLWLLRDTKGTGKADVKKSLSHGFGVHVAFLGHDLHGLRFGPDGKLYFSIGDRGLNVKTQEGATIFNPDSGAVLRCDPDGANLEIVATGLRNPQELAFDQYGNLFTCDNNSDCGDKARWVYIVEGGDSGWRIGYQYDTPAMGSRGPFNAEKIWHLPHEGQPAYIVPPLAHLADGPSGLCFNPGVTGLPDAYANHFFLCDFRGGAGDSGVRSLRRQAQGCVVRDGRRPGVHLVHPGHRLRFRPRRRLLHQRLGGGLGPDRQGPHLPLRRSGPLEDGKKSPRSRSCSPRGSRNGRSTNWRSCSNIPTCAFARRPSSRWRTRAQTPSHTLVRVAGGDKQLARLHAIWGLGQIGRKLPDALKPLVALLKDRDPEVRAQAAKVLGDDRADVQDNILPLLKDSEPRVQFLAAIALSKVGGDEAIKPLFDLLRENADKDAYLRHAGVLALTRIGQRDAVTAYEFQGRRHGTARDS